MVSALRLRVWRALPLLVVLSVLAAMPVGRARADTAAELRAAQARLHALEDKISGETAAISGLEADVARLAGRIDAVQSRIARTQVEIIRLQQQIDRATQDLLATQGQLNRRARVAYENGPGIGLEFLLGSHSLSDLNSRLEIVNSAAQTDQALIERIAVQRVVLGRRQSSMQTLEGILRSTQAQLKGQQDQLQAKLQQAQDILDQLDRDKSDAADQVQKLKEKRAREIAAAELAKRLALLSSQSSGATGPAGTGPQVVAGILQVCPVDQPHGYSDDFGAPRSAGGFHLHAGNDIFAPRGTPIRAPFDGTATEASNGLGGLAVEVTGASGYVYNAHLSSVGRLGGVSTGDIVGYVGDTGDARGGPSHDHFEWHPNSIPSDVHVSPYGVSEVNGAIDPFPFLNAVC